MLIIIRNPEKENKFQLSESNIIFTNLNNANKNVILFISSSDFLKQYKLTLNLQDLERFFFFLIQKAQFARFV